MDLLKAREKFIAGCKAKGAKTVIYKTPCCGKDLESLVPPFGSRWTSACICPYCNTMYMAISLPDAIEARIP